MDKKAISRIKKALTKNNCAVDKVRGCFVDEHGNIVAQLTEPFLAMPEEDADKYCEIFRKTLSGKPGKTLYSMDTALPTAPLGLYKRRAAGHLFQTDHRPSGVRREVSDHTCARRI